MSLGTRNAGGSASETVLSPPSHNNRVARIFRVVSGFMLGQGAAQGLSLLCALFLVRHMTVEAYAQFGLAMAFQSVFATLMDMGFASTIIPLVGERRGDAAVVGRYVRSAKHLRDTTFLVLAPVTSVTFLAVTYRQHWNWTAQLLLLSSVLLALYSGGKVSYYSAPLFIYGRLREYYLPQVCTVACRLFAYVLLAAVGGLNAWVAAGLGALNVTLNGAWIGRAGHALLSWPRLRDKNIDRELLRYILPASPAIIFTAFQSQITVFLISLFGGKTVYIAQVAALGRVSQIFSVLMTFNVIVIEPYLSRLAKSEVLFTYIRLTILSIVVSAPVVLLAFRHPQIFLWVLGPKYRELGGDIGWVVLAACVNYVAGLMWIMNRARRWVFWSGSALEVVLVLATQIAFIVFVGMHNTRQAVILTFLCSLCNFSAHFYGAVLGFWKGPKVLDVGAAA